MEGPYPNLNTSQQENLILMVYISISTVISVYKILYFSDAILFVREVSFKRHQEKQDSHLILRILDAFCFRTWKPEFVDSSQTEGWE